jgi:sulfur-oxidizing protein SoxX
MLEFVANLASQSASRVPIPNMRNRVVSAKPGLPDGALTASRSIAMLLAVGAVAGCAQGRAPSDVMEVPLSRVAGDAVRGREVFVAREAGHCVLCHAAPDVLLTGNIGPSMQGAGSRLSAAQLRLRVVDITRINPDAVMPSFYRVTGLNHVPARYRDQPVLSAQQVEDVVAFLGSLK